MVERKGLRQGEGKNSQWWTAEEECRKQRQNKVARLAQLVILTTRAEFYTFLQGSAYAK